MVDSGRKMHSKGKSRHGARRNGSKHIDRPVLNRKSEGFAIAGIIMVIVAVAVIILYLPGAISHKAAPQSELNSSWGSAGQVHMYDGGANHTYIINESIGNINITLNDTIMGPLTVYRGLILASTAGPYEYQLIANYTKTHGSVAAINAYTGKLVWRTHFPDQVIDQPITVGNDIYVTTGNNAEVPSISDLNSNDQIYALNIGNGSIIWNKTLIGPVMPTMTYYDNQLIAAGTGFLSFFNATTGNLILNLSTDLPDTMSSPLLVGNNIYFGAGYDNSYTTGPITGLFAFFDINFNNRSIVWMHNFSTAGGGVNDVVPTYYRGTVITGYLNHSEYKNPILVGLNSTTGRIEWQIDENETNKVMQIKYAPIMQRYTYVTEPSMSAITLWHGMGYSDTNYDGNLYAFNASTGAVQWIFHTGQCESNPNIYEGDAFIVNDGGILYVLNATTGGLINATYIGMPHLSNEVVITKNSALFTNLNGTILSIPLKTLLHKNT